MRQTETATSEGVERAAAIGEWRRRRLIRAGFDDELAVRLAEDGAVDLHELLVLLDHGCPPALAARILAPLDAPRPRC